MKEPKFLHAVDNKSGRIFIIKTRNPAYICEIEKAILTCIFLKFLEPVNSDMSLNTDNFAKQALNWYMQAIIKKEDNKNER